MPSAKAALIWNSLLCGADSNPRTAQGLITHGQMFTEKNSYEHVQPPPMIIDEPPSPRPPSAEEADAPVIRHVRAMRFPGCASARLCQRPAGCKTSLSLASVILHCMCVNQGDPTLREQARKKTQRSAPPPPPPPPPPPEEEEEIVYKVESKKAQRAAAGTVRLVAPIDVMQRCRSLTHE